ncbi:exodeoxyribonuclease VII large subunit [Staphylococcus haemolyticus]|nr:exodeoxyribonuclease VII large subunit [Staphylococcus haemolyticus]WRV63764.1 exodeoxyribonuclease VII large subunit [Staphylococcus haemolyticus]
MSRKESRMQAFQTLFQLEMKDTELTINEAINFIKDDEPELDFDFIHWLVTGVKDHEPVLDDTIKPHLKDWSLQRLLKTDRIILRMATFELLHSENSRYPSAEKIQISTLVQGTQAKEDIIKNIKYADSLGVDTIIVGRGGGSIEDLWNFNEEDVVKAIFECQTPIISAVGHETDFTLSDFVADVRAATPTQAAVMATPDQYELMQQIKQYQFSLSRYIKQYLEKQHKQLDHLASYYKFKQPSLLYDQQIQRKDDLERQLTQLLLSKIENKKYQLKVLHQNFNVKTLNQTILQNNKQLMNVKNRLSNLTMKNIHNNKLELKNKVELLNNLSPTNTMLRGYSIINKDDKVITSTQDLSKDDEITLAMKDGSVDAIVKKVRCEHE